MKTATYEPQKIVSITTRNNIHLLPLTCGYVENLVKGIGMPEEKTKTIRILTENVLKRRMINAYQGIGEITLDILAGLTQIIVEIRDKGLPYWVDVKDELESLPLQADVYRLKKLGTDGQCFSMTFYLEPDIDIMAFKKQDAVTERLRDNNLRIRLVGADEREITEVMKCIYSNYGYGYINHKIYDLQQMKAILTEGKQKSYIGANDHNQIMAHASLAFHEDFPGMPELGGLVSKPYCRGHNVAGRMVNAICEAGKDSSINGIFAMPVAFHPISQKILNKEGFIPVGVLLHYVTPESTGVYGDGDRRLDVFICAKLFKPSSDLKLSVPREHRLFVEQLYQSMGTGCGFLSPAEPSGEADFTMHYDKEIGIGQLLVDNAPMDFDKDLEAMMKDFTKSGIAMVEAYVNMNNPSGEFVCQMLKNQGFFFSGILPGSSRGEYMILQNTMGNPIEWDTIVAIGDYGRILNYVRDQKET